MSGAGRVAESRAKVEEAYALCPENPKVHRERGLQLLSAKQTAQGAEELRQAAQAQPADAGAAWEAAFALSAVGETEESLLWFDRVVHLQPTNGVAYAMIATGHLQRNRVPQALAAAQTGVRLSPRVPLTWFTLGLVYWESKQYEQATDALTKASALQPSDVRTLIALGAVSADAGKLDQAVGYLRRAVAVGPNRAEAWTALARAYRLCGRPEEAARAFSRAQGVAVSRPSLSQTATPE